MSKQRMSRREGVRDLHTDGRLDRHNVEHGNRYRAVGLLVFGVRDEQTGQLVGLFEGRDAQEQAQAHARRLSAQDRRQPNGTAA